MRVIAKRENAILVIAPLGVALCVLLRGIIGTTLSSDLYDNVFAMICVLLALRFVFRLTVPNVIMECDNKNLYINRRFSESLVIPLGDIINVSDAREKVDIPVFLHVGYLLSRENVESFFHALSIIVKTGYFTINYKGGYVRVHGVKNSKAVNVELSKIVSRKRKDFLAEIDSNIEKRQKY